MTTSTFLIGHGGALILPLAVVEGPVITIVTGFLTSQGYFDWYHVLPVLVCADLIGDGLYYGIGRAGIKSLGRFACGPAPALQRKLRHNATKMLLIGKWTHAIGGVVLVGCGILRVPLRRFIAVNLLATIPKSAVLFGFGYYAGDHLVLLQGHAVLGTTALCCAGVASIAFILRRTGWSWVSR